MTTPIDSTTARQGLDLFEPLLPPQDDISVKRDSEQGSSEGGIAVQLETNPHEVDRVLVDDEEPIVNVTWEQGEEQPAQCQNVFFAVLFLVQLGLVIYLAFHYIIEIGSMEVGPSSGGSDDGEALPLGFFYFNLLATAVAIGWSSLALFLFGTFAEHVIQATLIISPLIILVVSVTTAIYSKSVGAGMGGGLSFLLSVCYAWSVWHRIPFAAANLTTAMAAIRANFGIAIVSFVSLLNTMIFTLIWAIAVVGLFVTVDSKKKCNPEDDDGSCTKQQESGGELWIFCFFLLSLYWTIQVIQNLLHTTVAGLVGTWWFAPSEAASCCSRAVRDSLFRSMTYSFGSICLGSLVVAIVQVLHFLVRVARNNNRQNDRRGGGGELFLCLLECLINQLERLIKYVNKWAFVFVGLYGYDYTTAGNKAFQLFQARGWMVIINDQLVSRANGLLVIAIALVSGVTGWLIHFAMPPSWFSEMVGSDSPENASKLAFWTTFGYGLVSAIVVLRVVSSAVDSVVVCFAESPNELRVHHAYIARRMTEAWRAAYPSECGF